MTAQAQSLFFTFAESPLLYLCSSVTRSVKSSYLSCFPLSGCLSICVEAPHTYLLSLSVSLSLNFSLVSSKTERVWVETVRLSLSFSLFIFTLHLVLWLFLSLLPVSSLHASYACFPPVSHSSMEKWWKCGWVLYSPTAHLCRRCSVRI